MVVEKQWPTLGATIDARLTSVIYFLLRAGKHDRFHGSRSPVPSQNLDPQKQPATPFCGSWDLLVRFRSPRGCQTSFIPI